MNLNFLQDGLKTSCLHFENSLVVYCVVDCDFLSLKNSYFLLILTSESPTFLPKVDGNTSKEYEHLFKITGAETSSSGPILKQNKQAKPILTS